MTNTTSFTVTTTAYCWTYALPKKNWTIWDFSINEKDIHGRPIFWGLRPNVAYHYCHNWISEKDYVKKKVMIRKRDKLVRKFNRRLKKGL